MDRSTDVINAARIRVAGIGGLGLLAMALVVAFNVPRIGLTLGVGAIAGIAFAAALILFRRKNGPLPTSGGKPGANTVLSIDDPRPSEIEPATTDGRDLRLAPSSVGGVA
jgi:hypothetical protein